MRELSRWKPSDIAVSARPLLEQEQEQARARISMGGKGVKISRPSLAMDRAAERYGITGRTLRKIFDVAEAAAADPDRFGHLVAMMDKAGGPDSARKELNRILDEQRVLSLAPVAGRFRTLVVDPPWGEDNISRAAGHDYATMPFDQIRAMPVADWAEENCHLYLWATNNTLGLAFELIAGWGFAYKTVHTWTKSTIGLGRYFRNSTEHVLFAVRGELRTLRPARSVRTDHDWPVGANSEKPEGFYDLVRACSYPPYGEAFQRLARPDFKNLYAAPPAMSEAAE
ncbi:MULTISPECIES: MT-A70 family methyltransferase [unclassified Methylobacterium]|uniref:MT-A70 family methyltransferase n=1 Tax=unclassified Methylobacterium TaxID=2615210 RepID=UPI00226A34F8|nr:MULTISPECIES: MT-A70 family methyltransferase [unclassified Methylobacterium]